MKQDFQVRSFLSSQPFRTADDWEMTLIFCRRHGISTKDLSPTLSPDGITAAQFTQWFIDGFGPGDVVLTKGSIHILGTCTLSSLTSLAELKDGALTLSTAYLDPSQTLPASDGETQAMYSRLYLENLQYNRNGSTISDKHKAYPLEKVSYWGMDGEKGLGVILETLPGGGVSLLCAYSQETGRLEHSLDGVRVLDASYALEGMTRMQYWHFQKALGAEGLKWNDKMHRIEPAEPKAPVGKPYWYISDKMKAVKAVEKGTPTSHQRYLGGNYFLTQDECLECLGKVSKVLLRNLERKR